jgi:CHAD domain-containing protein
MPVSHLEIETTFDVPEAFEPPELAGVAGVAGVSQAPPTRLAATYYDTATLRLLRAGVTLRRRLGGTDAGWHLKLPRGRGRLEVHAPPLPDPHEVPAELRSLTRAVARSADLVPIAQVATVRRVVTLLDDGGDALAEVAFDDVQAEVGTSGRREWREVEVELVGGGQAVLDAVSLVLLDCGAREAATQSKIARALGAGAPPGGEGADPSTAPAPGTAAAAALAYCRRQVEAINGLDPQVRLNTPDAVHQMRVACRRLRSALATFRPVLDRTGTEPLREELRWLGQALGSVRDLEVLRERLLTRLDAVDASLVRKGTGQALIGTLETQHTDALTQARTDLDSDRYLGLLDALDGFLSRPPITPAGSRPADSVLRRRLRSDVDRVLDRAAAAAAVPPGPEREAALHEVRKAAKRARYAGEALDDALGGPARRVLAHAKTVQSLLGERQDAAVSRQTLSALAEGLHRRGQDPFTLGVLAGVDLALTSDQGADAEDYRSALRSLRRARRRLG